MTDDEKAHCAKVAEHAAASWCCGCTDTEGYVRDLLIKERSDAAEKARAGAYEEAAKVCDAMFDASEYPDGVMVGMAAERIRALAKQGREP